ncbi:insecticidal toxin complex protein TccC [Pseudomonas sp. IT-P100]|uniref:RHS repeat-associated core domain-containing protein n=1 Tax=Pseudomonas sp. IT-P100 TaxID=3026452 RepID=UPI0039E09B4A
MEPGHALHRNTPKLAVVDPRGLAVASVAYYRKTSADASPEPRVTRETFDVAGRSVANWDARLGSGSTPIASLTIVPALSGKPVLTVSVDAGWRLALQDEAGQVRQNWDGAGNTTWFDYDLMGRPLIVEQASVNAASQCVERLYYGAAEPDVSDRNQCGRLIRHADAAGRREVHDFSLQGEPLTESRCFLAELDHPGWPVAENQQNALLEQGEDKTYRTHWHYGASGEMLEQIDAAGHSRRYAYTVSGQLQSTWLKVAGKSEQLLVSDIAYNAFGQVERETAGNGVSCSSVYDPADGRLRQLLAIKGERCLQDFRYDYDAMGNILCMDDQSQPVSWFANQRVDPINRYGYDSLYQLISATGREVASAINGPARPELIEPPDPARLQNYSQSWCYDAGGNLLEQRHSNKPTHFMVIDTGSNRGLTRVEGQVPDFDAGFDGNGNLKFLTPGQLMRWTARNELREVVLVSRPEGRGDSERYIYDGAGMRVRKVRNALASSVSRIADVRYLPGLEIRTDGADSPGEVLQVLNVQAGRSNVRLLHWVHGQPDDQLRYSLDDHLGSSTLELDGRGDLISYEGYYPYGGTAWWMGRSKVEVKYKFLRYSGKELDATGLYYYGFRYYAPWLGRWLTPDPAWAIDGLNFYRMARNNPVTHRDEFGLYSGKGDAFERYVEDDGYTIVARGRYKLSSRENAHVERALGVAQTVVIEAIQELKSGLAMDSRLDDVYGPGVGEKFKPTLIAWFETLKDEMISYRSGSKKDQFVFLNSAKKDVAFVYKMDPEKRIFINGQAGSDDRSLVGLVQILIHEVSHLALNTHDFFYYERTFSDKIPDLVKDLKSRVEIAGKGLQGTDRVMVSNLLSGYHEKKISDDELIGMFGTNNLNQINNDILVNPDYRSQALIYNADSLAFAALYIGTSALGRFLNRTKSPARSPVPEY